VKEVPEEGEVIQWLRCIGLPVDKVDEYAVSFKENEIDPSIMDELEKDDLRVSVADVFEKDRNTNP
jgi:hypothetical protein